MADIHPLMQRLPGLEFADKRFTGGGDQGEPVVDRPLHKPLDMVDLRQVQKGGHHHRWLGVLNAWSGLGQLDIDKGQQYR